MSYVAFGETDMRTRDPTGRFLESRTGQRGGPRRSAVRDSVAELGPTDGATQMQNGRTRRREREGEENSEERAAGLGRYGSICIGPLHPLAGACGARCAGRGGAGEGCICYLRIWAGKKLAGCSIWRVRPDRGSDIAMMVARPGSGWDEGKSHACGNGQYSREGRGCG